MTSSARARSEDATSKPSVLRIRPGQEDNWNCRGRCLCRQRGRGAAGTNHRDLSAHELPCERRQLIHSAFRPAVLDTDIAVLNITGLTQALSKPVNEMSECSGRSAVKEPDHGHRRLLRGRRERPRDSRAAEQRDKLAASQLIELHSVPCQPIAGYRIGRDQSAGIGALARLPPSSPGATLAK